MSEFVQQLSNLHIERHRNAMFVCRVNEALLNQPPGAGSVQQERSLPEDDHVMGNRIKHHLPRNQLAPLSGRLRFGQERLRALGPVSNLQIFAAQARKLFLARSAISRNRYPGLRSGYSYVRMTHNVKKVNEMSSKIGEILGSSGSALWIKGQKNLFSLLASRT
jgi:hypothetical protein